MANRRTIQVQQSSAPRIKGHQALIIGVNKQQELFVIILKTIIEYQMQQESDLSQSNQQIHYFDGQQNLFLLHEINRQFLLDEPNINKNQLFNIANRNLASEKNDSSKGKDKGSSQKSLKNKKSSTLSNCKQRGIPMANLVPQSTLQTYKKIREHEQNSDFQACSSNDDSSKQGHYVSETKNIIKNFGRATLSFVIKNKDLTNKLIQKQGIKTNKFMKDIRRFKKNLTTIASLRNLWTDGHNPYAKILRVLSFQFLRRHGLQYVFNSRITRYSQNIRYRKKLLASLKDPSSFTSLK